MQCPKRAIALRLNREALDLLQSAPAKIVFDVSQDNGTSLVIGGKRFAVNYQPSQNLPHQVYQSAAGIGAADNDNAITSATPVQLLANVVHTGTLKQVLSKEEKTRMRHLTEQAEREKNARRTELITTMPLGSSPRRKASTPTRQRVLSPTSVRASPSRTSSTTNKPVAGSSPISSSASTPSSASVRLDPAFIQSVRERLIHLLAIYPHPFSQLTTKLKIREKDLMPILKKVAVESKGNWCLRPEVYKELRIWEWKRYDDKERSTVIKNAEDAYDALRLPRNAPERHNLVQQRKKASPQTLLAPPPQRTSSNDSAATTPTATPVSNSKIASAATAAGATSGNTNSSTATVDGRSPAKRSAPSSSTNTKADEKRSKTESKGKVKAVARKSPQKPQNQKQRQQHQSTPSLAAPSSTSSTNITTTNSIPISTTTTAPATVTHTNSTSHKESPHHPSKGRKQPQTTATTLPTSATRMTRTESGSPATLTTSSSASGSSENEDEEEESYETVVVSPITTQAQFWAMCKNHDEAQQEYIRLKHKISKDHPLYVSALSQVDEPHNVKDEEQRRDIYYSRVKTAYANHGGTEWRAIVQLTRQFNHQLSKVNAIWDEVERAYQEHRFSLPSSRR